MPTSNAMSVLETLLEPQERFDELCAVARSRFGRGVIDLSCPNPCDGPDDETCQALRLAIDNERELGFQDTEYGGRTVTRRLIASRLAQEYGLPFTYRDVVLTAGATAALNIVLRTLFGSADEVVVLTPCWFDYSLYLQNLGIPIHFVPLRDDKHLDLPAIGRALNTKTRGILFSHPCCPTGVLYSREEIQELAALLTRTEKSLNEPIYIISDEVHRHLIWSSKEFYSPLLAYSRSVAIYSFGEELFLPGQRIGYVAVSPRMPEREDVRRQLERAMRIMGFGTPTTLMQRAVCDLLEHRPPLNLIAARQKATRSRLKASGYEVCDGDATFFVYVKAPIADDFKFAELLAAQGVLVLPSTFFHERGYFRISVTPHSQSPQEGLPVFQRVLFLI
jgi:aspartate aminotransferase